MEEEKKEDNQIQEKTEPPIKEQISTAPTHQINVISKEEEFVEDKGGKVHAEDDLIQIRKENIIKFFKTNYNWIAYLILAFITYTAIKIRTSNLDRLKDVTTGTWTLGPDLDPFFFLRLSKYIVEHGTLFVIDNMRYVPQGFRMGGEYLLHPYLMAWFHKIAVYFGSESVTHSAVLYPAFMFGLTVVAFFFMTRQIFVGSMGDKNANIIALIASFFLSVIPSLLPRTIAGIPEKESAAFLFLFLAFYFFLASWKSKSNFGRYFNAILAGASTAGMAHIWGGYIFIFYTLTPAIFIAFLFGQMDKNKTALYATWLFSSYAFMIIPFSKYSIKGTVSSLPSGSSLAILFIIITHYIIFNTKLKSYFQSQKISKVPPKVISTIITVILLAILSTLLFGTSFVWAQLTNVIDTLIKPATTRLIQTVAENRQPYFNEWANSFGPHYRGIPVTFWLFFVGSIYLFTKSIKIFRKNERLILTLAYFVLLTSVIFSRYAANSNLNGENTISKLIYGMGFAVFVATFGFYYYKYHKNNEEYKFKQIDFRFLLLFSLFFLSIVAARAAVRTIMVLVPSASIIVSYLLVASINDARKVKDKTMKIFVWALVAIIIIATLFAANGFYKSVKGQAPGHVPSSYTQQWQKAMGWVRENTPETAVFGHWWDYGYWLQTIGERATVLDGGNAIAYWNHLMGRHALTGPNDQDALEFLYAHDTTHFLIDSTDIGKYSAFSSIGSDINYDRASYIPTFSRNDQSTRETKNSTIFYYQGGAGLDEDIVYDLNGTKIFLPKGRAGIGALLIEKDASGKIISQPQGIFVDQGKQYTLPLRYSFDGEFKDYGSGVEAGFFLFPRVVDSGEGIQIDDDGSMLYLSGRTVKSQLARLYLYKEDNPNFKLVHSEDDFFVAQIKSQNPTFTSDFISYRGLRGPIRIWEINYPEDIELKEEYLSTEYPEEILYGR